MVIEQGEHFVLDPLVRDGPLDPGARIRIAIERLFK
jgi:hypothetical protein